MSFDVITIEDLGSLVGSSTSTCGHQCQVIGTVLPLSRWNIEPAPSAKPIKNQNKLESGTFVIKELIMAAIDSNPYLTPRLTWDALHLQTPKPPKNNKLIA